MKNTTTSLLVMIGLAVATGACQSPSPAVSAEEGVDSNGHALWFATGAIPWGQVIPVCFQASVSSATRSNIRTVLENGWERAANINFTEWADCNSGSSAAGKVMVSIDASAPEPGSGSIGRLTSNNVARFQSSSPADRLILHAFGHVLGFADEEQPGSNCQNRTSGGFSVELENDTGVSVMSTVPCATHPVIGLSTWDIIGIRRIYNLKPPGSIVGVNGLCLNISGANPALGAGIIGWSCTGGSNDTWARPSDDSRLLKSSLTTASRCLNIAGGVVDPNHFTSLISWDCVEVEHERFVFNRASWMGMATMCVTADSLNPGAKLSMQACHDFPEQQWNFFDGDRRIHLGVDPSLCVKTPTFSRGTALELQTCAAPGQPAPNETFVFQDGFIKLSSMCLNVSSGTTKSGNPIILWDACSAGTVNFNAKFSIRGRLTSKSQCVSLLNTVPATDGAPAVMFPCLDRASHIWEQFW